MAYIDPNAYLECIECGAEIHLGQTVYYDTQDKYRVFCSEECFESYVRNNLSDYMEIIKDQFLLEKQLEREDFLP